MEFEKLYKIDTKGKLRVWWCETDGGKYRIHAGIDGGKIVTSTWKTTSEKNVGKVNSTTVEEQATSEVNSLYEKQLKTYSKDKENAGVKKFFEPMLAVRYDKIKNINFDSEVFSQPKLDGIRCIVNKNGIFSRNGEKIVSSPHIFETLKFLFDVEDNSNLVLDGELYNHELNENFNKLQSLIMKTKPTDSDLKETEEKVQYHIYDMFDFSSPDAVFSLRTSYINYISYNNDTELTINNEYIKFVDTVPVYSKEDLDNEHGKNIENGYEGSIYRLNTPYENKRTNSLIKRKDFFDAEYEIVGFEEGQGNWSGCVKRVTCKLADGRTFGAGMRGSQEEMRELLKNKEKYIGSDATIRYPNLTPDGLPRFGVCVMIHDGKRRT
jgi:DNA ligase 1